MPSLRSLFWLSVLPVLLLATYCLHPTPLHTLAAPLFPSAKPRPPRVNLLASIPRHLVPTPFNGRRLIVVGDIHGMLGPLDALLADVGFDPSRDHLVATGDMISKGPDSGGVLDRLVSIGASAVRGNHEDHILKARWKMDKKKHKKEKKEKEKNKKKHRKNKKHGASASALSEDEEYLQDKQNTQGAEGTQDEEETQDEDDGEATAESHKQRDRKVARSLTAEHVAWLSQLPAILSARPLPIFIVHAGLVPGVEVDRQDAWAVMNMRTIVFPKPKKAAVEESFSLQDEVLQHVLGDEGDGDSHHQQQHTLDPDGEEPLSAEEQRALLTSGKRLIPVDTREGKRWADVWNKYQRRKPARKRRTVIYGHDAKRGHREGDYTFGLDSGCVQGGELTAVVITGKKGGWHHETVQVDCAMAS